jgi:hypothetical protein
VLYLLDANVLITASNTYYQIDQIPEFWAWLQHQGRLGNVKLPVEILEEILAGRKNGDPLLDWMNDTDSQAALKLNESVDASLVREVVSKGYAPDLTDDEIEEIGRDPFLIAYGMAGSDRCVVTTEVSKPSKKRQNRKIPDVCNCLSVACCNPFQVNRALGFHTAWKP